MQSPSTCPSRLAAFAIPFLLFLVSLTATAPARGQTATLRGTVVDASTGEVLVGAHVVLQRGEARFGTSTRDDGSYDIPSLPPGTYTVRVSYVGYLLRLFGELALAPGETRVLDVSLEASAVEVNPVTVTASRTPEKLLDAPASITVLEPRELEARAVLTAAEHLKAVPSVDIVSTGINQSRVVIRGFNDNLASSLLTLVDNRIARIPSIRLTALQLIPMSNADIERIEVVSGPASALYGPNAANGVVHIITRSPFDSRGTTINLSAGEQDIFSGSLRHAGVFGQRLGYRVYAQYYQGRDYQFFDPVEQSARQAALAAGADPDTLRIADRDFDVRNLAFDARVDYRLGGGGTATFSGGLTRGDNIETSPTGAVQAKDAVVSYLQGRLHYGHLFAQAFFNHLDAGASYALRTGQAFIENSSLFVAQVQHATSIGDRQHFTYGADVYLTRPDTRYTVNGRYEDDDDVNEAGAYVQSETAVTNDVNVVLAARLDHQNRLDGFTFSPRAAVVVKPLPGQNLRLTFNRAFETPSPNELFTDVLGQRDLFEGYRLEPLTGFAPAMDLRAQGTPSGGFHFRRGTNGLPQFRSPYAPLDPRGRADGDFIDLNDPVFTNVMWGVARQATVAGLAGELASRNLLAADAVDALSSAVDALLPRELSDTRNALMLLDVETQRFVPVTDVQDIDPLDVTQTETYEIGYKGIVGRQLMLGLDVYHTRVKNFIGPFLISSPTVFLDSPTLQAELLARLQAALADPDNASYRDALLPLDRIPFLGNGDGSGVDELASLVSTGVATAIPFGTVTPQEAFEPDAVLLTRRNFGNIALNGLDARFMLFATRRLRLGGSYSYVSRDLFEDVDGVEDIALNAPRHKWAGIVRYVTPAEAFNAEVRVRHVAGFPVRSDVYIGAVDPYTILDASVAWRPPFSSHSQITLTLQNLLDNVHREFVAVPEVGRLAMLQYTYEF